MAAVSLSLASCAGEDPVGDDPDSESVTGGGSGSEDGTGGESGTEGGEEGGSGSGEEGTGSQGGSGSMTDDEIASTDCTITLVEVKEDADDDLFHFRILQKHSQATMTVDWGDGTVETYTVRHSDYISLNFENEPDYKIRGYLNDTHHEYTDDAESHRVTIRGKGILYFNADGDEVYSIDCSDSETLQALSLDASGLPERFNPGVTELILPQPNRLRSLYVQSDKITSIDLSHCTELEYLEFALCYGSEIEECPGRLTSLDLSHCTKLKELVCSEGGLESLNLRNCASLEILRCAENNLTSLDVSDCVSLQKIDCHINELTSLDIASCEDLTYLDCRGNDFYKSACDELIYALPVVDNGRFFTTYLGVPTPDYDAAERKGWKVNDDDLLDWRYQ